MLNAEEYVNHRKRQAALQTERRLLSKLLEAVGCGFPEDLTPVTAGEMIGCSVTIDLGRRNLELFNILQAKNSKYEEVLNIARQAEIVIFRSASTEWIAYTNPPFYVPETIPYLAVFDASVGETRRLSIFRVFLKGLRNGAQSQTEG